MKATNQPSVYVGTYAKYNNSNLSGKWINLLTCKGYTDFVQKCKEVHKDEADPELMIQDSENLPDGLGCGEWIDEEEFNDIVKDALSDTKYQIIDYSEKAIAVIGDTKGIKDQLKKMGGRFNARLTCGAGWVFSKTKLQALKTLLNADVEAADVEAPEHIYKESLLEFAKSQNEDCSYYTKKYIGAIKINGLYMLFGKQSIQNKFCFPDEGPSYDYYKELKGNKDKLKKYFLAENLRDIDDKLDNVKSNKPAYLCKDLFGTLYLSFPKSWESCDGILATNDNKEEITKALQFCKTEFEKRLQTYLKKYDVSKLNIWTYWADR